MTVLFEIPLGKGRVFICDLDFEESVAMEPAAQLLLNNLLEMSANKATQQNPT